MFNSHIFLAGHHRSGTSLLHSILREHPEISGLHNTNVPEDEGQHVQSVYKPAGHYGGPGKYIFHPDSYMNETHPLCTEDSAKTIMQDWLPFTTKQSGHFIEKSPPNLIRTRFLQKLFPCSKFIVILRHPVAVAYATQKWSKTSTKSLVEHTLRGYELFWEDSQYLKNCHVLRYEDFVQNPNAYVKKICNFLDLDNISVAQKVKKDVNDKYFEMWKAERKNLFKRLQFPITRSLETRFNKYGYSLKNIEDMEPF